VYFPPVGGAVGGAVASSPGRATVANPDAGREAIHVVPEGELIVEMRHVSKRFGRVPALSNLTILVPKGRITVLLGPNGAGKTTAIRVITGALAPDAGHIRTFGKDPNRDGEDVRRRCGVVSAKPALYDRLSGWDNLQYSAELYGLGRNAVAQIREAAGRFGILEALDQQVGGYSTGMKTRLALARSVLHNPDLLLFDEPTSGLDPESSHAVLELIREMTDDGRTVVMCTHLLIEAEGLADQIVVLESGTDLMAGTQQDLIKRYWPNDLVRIDAEDPAALDQLASWDGVVHYERNGVAEVHLDSFARVPDLVAKLAADGVRLTRVEPHKPTLEELYFAVRRERRSAGVQTPL
jgi:ABC-2 type transport system ATP-binding protein